MTAIFRISQNILSHDSESRPYFERHLSLGRVFMSGGNQEHGGYLEGVGFRDGSLNSGTLVVTRTT
jgi:hypothetical protein